MAGDLFSRSLQLSIALHRVGEDIGTGKAGFRKGYAKDARSCG